MRRWNPHFHAHVDLRDPELLQSVARIEALAELTGAIPLPPGRRNEAGRLNILRAVRGAIGIEGGRLTEGEAGRILDAAPDGGPVLGAARAREEAEARNAARVMDYVRSAAGDAPDDDLSERHVREMHRLATGGIGYPHNTPGAYREVPVAAGGYRAPPPGEIGGLMDRFFEWFPLTRERDRWPECVRAVAGHFYLISIHPFGDGNGRTSRAAESLVLYRGGVGSLGFYSLAAFYCRNRADYEESLDRARFVHDDGERVDLTEFVKFALGGLRGELAGVHAEALGFLRELAFRDHARESLREDGALRSKVGARRLELVLRAAEAPIPVADLRARRHPAAALYAGATNKTLARDIGYLRERRLVLVEDGAVRANLELTDRSPGEAAPPGRQALNPVA